MSRLIHTALVSALCAPGILAAQNTGKITGKVIDAVTHQPIPGVHVSSVTGPINGGQFVGSLTGADGSYILEDVPPGAMRMTLNLDGHEMIDERLNPSAAFPLAAGDTVRRDFEMHPLGRIYGKLVDRDTGAPIKGHTVSAVAKESVPGHIFFVPRRSQQNGEEFEIRNLEPGDYLIQVDLADNGIIVAAPEASPKPAPPKCYGQTWYPDVPRIEMAATIHLAEGESRRVDLSLQSRDTHSLSGLIKAPREFEDKPVTLALSTTELRGSVAMLPAPGPFRIDNLAPGTYRLALIGGKKPPDNVRTLMDYELTTAEQRLIPGKPPNEVVGDYTFEIKDRDIDDYKAVLSPYAGVSGEVRMLEKDAKLPDKLGLTMMPTADFLIELKGGGAIGNAPLMISGAAIEGGRFHQDLLHPGEYWPLLRGLPDGYAVAQVLFDGASLRNSTILLSAPDTPITFVLTSRPGAISGIVRTEEQAPVRGASVLLMPDPLPDKVAPEVIQVQEAGDDGGFAFRNLAPGRYRALVLNRADRDRQGDVAYLRDQASGEAIEVQAGQSVVINLKQ